VSLVRFIVLILELLILGNGEINGNPDSVKSAKGVGPDSIIQARVGLQICRTLSIDYNKRY